MFAADFEIFFDHPLHLFRLREELPRAFDRLIVYKAIQFDKLKPQGFDICAVNGITVDNDQPAEIDRL